jgi:hypothetical protein
VCCGRWRVEVVNLDGQERYLVQYHDRLADRNGIVCTPQEVAELLRRLGGPELSEFEECT